MTKFVEKKPLITTHFEIIKVRIIAPTSIPTIATYFIRHSILPHKIMITDNIDSSNINWRWYRHLALPRRLHIEIQKSQSHFPSNKPYA
jgi:hypothetical protein